MPSTKAPVDNFDETIKDMTPSGFSSAHKLCFGSVALIASAVPAYLFISKFFSVSTSYYPVFIVATLVCTVLLAVSYNKLAIQEFGRVMLRKKTYGEDLNEETGKKEAAAYAMFITNLIFEGCVFLFSFVVMPRFNINVPTYVIYAIIAGLSGAIAFGFSYGLF